jgi:hypothetical protein
MVPFHFVLEGVGVPGAGNLWPGGQMLEEGDQRDCGHQDPEEPSQLCQTGTDRGLHPLQAQVTVHSPFIIVLRHVTALSLRTVYFLSTLLGLSSSLVPSVAFYKYHTVHQCRFFPPATSLPYFF